ncbi:hypothetical protein B0J12DRAFT_122557 [Macrophomina phaseolina]|uniref:Secreted protein n=1 Tax=Macrophomina phaseolina TaxID=35725 RepID=A0ABQ8GAA4_9PEZI|nr:hypothetical protein B0J12DRAFT_122557 [Macrophomina phaseolina]
MWLRLMAPGGCFGCGTSFLFLNTNLHSGIKGEALLPYFLCIHRNGRSIWSVYRWARRGTGSWSFVLFSRLTHLPSPQETSALWPPRICTLKMNRKGTFIFSHLTYTRTNLTW